MRLKYHVYAKFGKYKWSDGHGHLSLTKALKVARDYLYQGWQVKIVPAD